MLALRRVAAVSAVSRRAVVGARMYSTGRNDGSVAESKGFNKKEAAHENQYVHQHELEQLKKLREQIANTKANLDDLEKKEAALDQAATKKQ